MQKNRLYKVLKFNIINRFNRKDILKLYHIDLEEDESLLSNKVKAERRCRDNDVNQNINYISDDNEEDYNLINVED